MKLVRVFVAVAALGLCLAFVEAALADLGLTITTLNVRVGDTLRGYGNASGMPVYLVPESHAPHPISCHDGAALCAPRSWQPPGKPYVLLGYLRRTRPNYKRQRFAFRVPAVAPGRYQVAFWCQPCGRRLILAGATLHGQVVTVGR
jgi:hypothetical protein